jgi:hypothetical protein
MDSDIWFWHQWRKAGRNIYIDPSVSIGHLEEVVSVYDSAFQPQHMYVKDWQKQFAGARSQ